MYEYKVLVLAVKECEEAFNRCAKEGWRVVSTHPDIAKGMGVVATLEREADESTAN